MALELFVLPNSGGLYPRRVYIYLYEKGIISLPSLTITPTAGLSNAAPGKLPGSVPQLRITNTPGEDSYILESLPIIDYFEDLCDAAKSHPPSSSKSSETQKAKQLVLQNAGLSMRGENPEDRARVKQNILLADEATTHFSTACHRGSALFALLEYRTNGNYGATQAALASCHTSLQHLNTIYQNDSRFANSGETTDGSELDGKVTIGDCVLFALLQFSLLLYSMDLAEGLDGLQRVYRVMEKRESTRVKESTFPVELRMLASRWVKETSTPLERVGEGLKVGSIYLIVILKMVGSLVRRQFGK